MRIVNGKALPTETETEILGFFEKYRAFSNFHLCPVEIDGLTYPSSEHAYMAMKTMDAFQRKKLSTEWPDKPNEAKKYGQTVTLRPDWEQVKVAEMSRVLIAKFKQNRDLLNLLFSTGIKRLEETNWWNDKFWGVCEQVGENNLGKCLMDVRAALLAEMFPNLNFVQTTFQPVTISEGKWGQSSFKHTEYALTLNEDGYNGPDGMVRGLGSRRQGEEQGVVFIDPVEEDHHPDMLQTFVMDVRVHDSHTPESIHLAMQRFMSTLVGPK